MSTILLGDHLILHGSICMLIGLLCGAPLGRAINNSHGDEAVHGWRVAHLGLALGGPLLYSVAMILSRVSSDSILDDIVAWSFVASVYGFIAALPLGASIRNRGLQPGQGIGQICYMGNIVGAAGALVGTAVLILLAGVRVIVH